uniref:Elongation factor Ts, mitochondrial n=1 Tax=Leachiella pacifica TaxID=282357 RepID=A0A3S8UVX0_9FLOR|nr:translation elongation factor Ts [Leachiella pacifica]
MEGIIFSYIHTNHKVGVMIELNCETDFVSKRPEFYQLAKNIAMQIAASDLIHGSNDNINNKLTVKKNQKLLLMKSFFIKNNKITIEQLINQNIILLGENIIISRFIKFILAQK